MTDNKNRLGFESEPDDASRPRKERARFTLRAIDRTDFKSLTAQTNISTEGKVTFIQPGKSREAHERVIERYLPYLRCP